MDAFKLVLLISLSGLVAFSYGHETKIAAKSEQQVIEQMKINPYITMLRGAGGNIAVVELSDTLLMIDSQYARTSNAVLTAVKSISNKPLSYLVNTHYHSDHTGGSRTFAKHGARIIAHENTRQILSASRDSNTPNPRLPKPDDVHLPSITVAEGLTLFDDAEEIEIRYFAHAHTNSDVAIFFKKANVIHTGDLYFVGVTPFIDVDNGGSYQGYLDAMQAILERANEHTQIIPGHGPLATKAMMQADYQRVSEFDHTALD